MKFLKANNTCSISLEENKLEICEISNEKHQSIVFKFAPKIYPKTIPYYFIIKAKEIGMKLITISNFQFWGQSLIQVAPVQDQFKIIRPY